MISIILFLPQAVVCIICFCSEEMNAVGFLLFFSSLPSSFLTRSCCHSFRLQEIVPILR